MDKDCGIAQFERSDGATNDGAKKAFTDEERIALADKMDKDLDTWINSLEKKAYADGWAEDKWQEEMEKHPFFMTKFPENHSEASPLLQGIQQLKYDENANTPTELAQSYKEDGNFNFKHKKYRMAVISYTEGIKQKCGDADTNVALYNNRSAAQFFLGNYGSSLLDCKQCLRINPKHDKAELRAIECSIQLHKAKDALALCSSYAKRNPDCERVKRFQLEATAQLKKNERDRRKREKEEARAANEVNDLVAAITGRGVKIEINGDIHEVLSGMHEKPKLQADASLTWPVFFLYPEYSSSDFVQEFNENSTILDVLECVTAETADWDTRGDYRANNLSVYYEADDRSHLYRVNQHATLANVLQSKQCVARDFRPAFLIFVKNSPVERNFVKNYTEYISIYDDVRMNFFILGTFSVGASTTVVAYLWPSSIWAILFVAVLCASALLGLFGTLTAFLTLSTNHITQRCPPSMAFADLHKYITESLHQESCRSPDRLQVVFGRSVDIALQQLLDLLVTDLISPWLEDLAFSPRILQQNLKAEIWYGLGRLRERFAEVDETKLIAVDIVTKITQHFEKIRIAQSEANGAPGHFLLSPHLATPEKEQAYLRKISELLLTTLCSRSTISTLANRNLLIEILTCKGPCIDLLTDPDYINNKLVEYMEHVKRSQDLHRMTYAHAESYEEFIQLIRASDNMDHLKHMRYTIMTEIMQATTIQNLKKSKVDKDRDLECGKKLRRYLGQLSLAKAQCESRLKALDCSGFGERDTGTHRMAVPLDTVLESVAGRKRVTQFLELSGEEALLSFWAAVEELRLTDKKNWHQIGAEIYYTFIHSPLSVIKVEKSIRRKIESFLLGDAAPDVFYEVQDAVMDKLSTKIYPSFLASDLYLMYLQDVDKAIDSSLSDEHPMFGEDEKEETVFEHKGYARTKLSQLEERLNNKSQALHALRSSLKPESKVLSGLEKEVEQLEGEKRQLEAHLTRTEAWGEHLGKWRAVVQSVEVSDDKEPQFVLVVHVMEDEHDTDAISTGWVVLRKLVEFYDLHRKMCQLWTGAKQLDLPSQSPKFLFGKQLDKLSSEKAKCQVQKYLECILKEERVNASEPLYAFLSPSSEHLKAGYGGAGLSSPKKLRFSFSTLFKGANASGGSDGSRESDEEDSSLLDDGVAEGKDAVAEPLYTLLSEVFDLRGVFRWLRKTLIAFVQITYGRTISRQVGETVAWLISESMVHYYIQQLTQAWWPDGKLERANDAPTAEEKLLTRQIARNAVSSNTPEVLNNLVGVQNARRGALKVFETLQDERLNKQLFYELLELILYELYPEIRRKIAPGSPLKRAKVSPP